jgi:hypothetical protein
LTFFLAMLVLSGCMYPQNELQQIDQLPLHIAQVQSAVEAYQHQFKFLPYKYEEDEYKFTTKYLVNFQELAKAGGQIPPTAFEKGGTFIYVLTDVETKPQVKVFDLRVNDKVSEIQPYVLTYLKEHGKLPAKEKVADGYYSIDYEKLGIDPVTIPSPYHSDLQLPLIIDEKGRVYVDYRMDAMRMIQESKQKPSGKEDLRYWMSRHSYFVPAFSPPMVYRNQEPVLMKP